jgi:hypothetical protein
MKPNEILRLQEVNPDSLNDEVALDLKSIKTSSRTGVVKLKEGRIPVWKKQKLRMLNKPIPVQLPLPLRR